MITMLLVLIVLCLIIPWRIVGFLMILGVSGRAVVDDAEDGPAGHPSISQKDT